LQIRHSIVLSIKLNIMCIERTQQKQTIQLSQLKLVNVVTKVPNL